MIFYNDKTPFQAINTRSSKSRNIDIFPKGLTHGFAPRMASFPTFIFQAINPRKMSFMIFQNGKTFFQSIKTRSSKRRGNDIFPKGLTHGLGPKIAIFSTFFFYPLWARKISFIIFQNEKTPFQALKTRSSKSRKIDIFPKGLTHGFGRKMAIFGTFFLQALQARKMSLMIFYNEKTPCQAINTRISKSRKIDILRKVLTHGFGRKMAIFCTFFVQALQARKCLL